LTQERNKFKSSAQYVELFGTIYFLNEEVL